MQSRFIIQPHYASKDVVAGRLLIEKKRKTRRTLLVTSCPRTLLAAAYAAGAETITFEALFAIKKLEFPLRFEEMAAAVEVWPFREWLDFVRELFISSVYDYYDPSKMGTRGEFHLRTAVHHLPEAFVKRRPTGSAPEGFDEAYESLSKAIYPTI